jgi:hypothetical protein
LDQLPDLTDKAARAVVTLKGRDNFNSEYLYDVSVKNLSSDPLVGESLVIVLDTITNIGGDDRTSGTRESILSRMDILGQDGETDEGKPYFRIPRGSGPDLSPYTESSPATVRIRNKDYLIVFTPVFKVYGRPPHRNRRNLCRRLLLQPRPRPISSFRCLFRKACSLKKKGARSINHDPSRPHSLCQAVNRNRLSGPGHSSEVSNCDQFANHVRSSIDPALTRMSFGPEVKTPRG